MEKSCELCNSRKVKCDRMKPSCGWCKRNNRNCTYTERKKPGINGVDIEGKINSIEARLLALAHRIDNHISYGHEVYNQQEVFETPPALHYHTADEIVRGSPETCDSVMHRSVLNSPQPGTLFAPPMYDATESLFSYSPPSSLLQSPADLSEHDLPPHYLLCDLVSLFFKHVLAWAPILDRETISTLLSGSYSALQEEDHVLLHAIVATTLRFSQDPALTPELHSRYHRISKQRVQVFALENSSIKALQALALVAVDVLGTSDGPEGRKLLVLLVRGIIQLNLDIEKTIFQEASPTSTYFGYNEAVALPRPPSWAEEGRRRLVWLVYMLDIDFASDEILLDTPFPNRYDLCFSPNDPSDTTWPTGPDSMEITHSVVNNLESFTYYCQVLKILSRIYRFLQEPVDIMSPHDIHCWKNTYHQLDGELINWLSSLPAEYNSISQICSLDPTIKNSTWIMIHATYIVSVIRLHSAAAYPIMQTHIFVPSQNAVLTCLAATESLGTLAQSVVKAGALGLLGHPFAVALWTSARLLLVHAATMQCDIDPSIWFLIKTLEQMKQYWEVAGHYAQTLKHFVGQGRKNELEGFPTSSVNYTDMRQHTFNLSMVASRHQHALLEPSSTQTISANDIRRLDVFGIFHYPRLATKEGDNRLTNATSMMSTSADSADIAWKQDL